MKNGICKLGDLNVSKVANSGLLKTQTGTPYFASPEVWSGKPYGLKSDIWSLGCILYQITTLKMPFQGNNFKEVYNNISKCKYQPLPTVYSKELDLIIKKLLQIDPEKRPNCQQILEDPIVIGKLKSLLGTNLYSIFEEDKEAEENLPKNKADHENEVAKKINNDKNNNSIHTNDKNDKLFETIKFKNSYQTYDLNNSKNENDIYFEQIRNKEENLNFKNVSTNKNYIKKIDKMNNKTLNIMKNNNIVKRTCDILNNDPLERLNLTSRNQRLLKEKFDNVNNDSYLSTEKSYFLFDKINNINELQKSNCETLNYNSITNPGNNVYIFPYTNYIDNIYPKENYTLLNPFETHRIINSSIGKQYSNILNE
jgi:serine/threonine protein kinase